MSQIILDIESKQVDPVNLVVIGGSGLYQIDSLKDVVEVSLETPFGSPSDRFTVGRLGSLRVGFLPRHARGHKLLPSEINYKANMWAVKNLENSICS